MCHGNCRVMPGRRNELGLRRHEGFQVVEGRGAVDAGADDEMEEVCPDDVAIRCGPGPETKNGPLPSRQRPIQSSPTLVNGLAAASLFFAPTIQTRLDTRPVQ